MIEAFLLSPFVTFIFCVGICYSIAKHKNINFKKSFFELILPLIGFAVLGGIIGFIWGITAYMDVAQGALTSILTAPLGASIGQLLGLGIWARKKMKSNH